MFIIPVNPLTRYMIAELNNGIVPDLVRDTYFVWSVSEPAEIVTGYSVRQIKENCIEIPILFAKEV